MPRVGVDATAVSAAGKGHARSQRKLVEALAALGRYEVVAYVRTREAAGLLPGIDTVVIGEGRAIGWEQLGVRRALRGLDAFVTLGDRLPVGAEGRIVVWLFEVPTHRIAENRRRGAGWYQRGSDLLTSALWRRSLRPRGRGRRGLAGDGGGARGRRPGRLPGPGRRLRPRPGPRGALRLPSRLVRPARQHGDRARRLRAARHRRGAPRRRRPRRPRAGAASARRRRACASSAA